MPENVDLKAPWRIGVDVGGTFTDLVLADGSGRTRVAKVPSVRSDPSQGVLDAVERLATTLNMPVEALLAGTSLFVHGSTVATNTMLEGKGSRVGLLTTAGFRDALELRRGLREDQWDHRAAFAPVLVPRYLRRAVGGRIDRDGDEIEPLEPADVRAALTRFEAEGVEAVAIGLFNSFLNPSHEHRTEALIREQWSPNQDRQGDIGEGREVWVSCSADVSPLMGEYERTSTAVVNASLSPRIVDYLRALDRRLQALGLRRPILLVQSNGGTASVTQLASRPVSLLLSGPAAAVGALELYRCSVDTARAEFLHHAPPQGDDNGNLISMEIGGTSCDVMLMSNGEVSTRDSLMIGGYHVSTPALDIHTIGAGGGTIAGVDSAGLLYVGPQGAGADPGPASYGLGGTEPTVTDAQLVLGRLRPGPYADGSLSLSYELAHAAIEQHISRPLGITVEQAAAGIVSLLEQNLLHAVEYISIERGHSPRRFTLLAAGGAGPMHGANVARGLGCAMVYVPRDAGALCAVGMLHADVRQDFVRFLMGSLDEVELGAIKDGFSDLEKQALATLGEEGFSRSEIKLDRELDLHYTGQLWSIRVRHANDPVDGAAREVIRAAFEAEYERIYGHAQPAGTIMVASLRVTARASTGRVSQVTAGAKNRAAGPPQPREKRPVWHGEHGWLATPVYVGDALTPGDALTGPLLVEEATTTVFLGPEDELVVDRAGNFVLRVPVEGDESQNPSTSAPKPLEHAPGRDPVVLALMQNRLDQISRHMGWAMTRTARSPIFSQSHDFSCYLTNSAGTLVANADGIPIHTGGGGFAVRALLRDYAGRIRPEDVFILSDPYEAGGNHLPDWVVARPIFIDRQGHGGSSPQLVGFCCNRAHQSDIGGGVAGTYNPEATEIWQEGIRLPVCRLVDAGEVRDDLWRLLLLNSRTPELLDGDLRAMLGSTRIGGERVAALANELGADAYFEHLEGVLEHADARMREAVLALPDGTYRGEEHTDNDCFKKVDVAIRVALIVEGSSLTVDFTGTDPQIAGFKNSSVANTYSSVFLALSSFFDTDIPRNEGTYRGVTIIAPEGSVVNACPPAPMTMNTVFVAHEIVHAVWKALAEAEPSRACAGWSKTVHNHVAGTDSNGKTWVMYQWHAMGTPGATAERDGFAQMGHLISLGGLDLPNLEFHEQMYPVRYRRWEFRLDAAGRGKRRGGCGVRYEAELLSPALWSFRAEGLDTPSGYGVNGGSDGAVGEVWITPSDEEEGSTFIPPKYGVRHLGPARMIADTPGGGGWGDPLERDCALVLRDVQDEVVSVNGALEDYGVVVHSDGLRLDLAATRVERQRRMQRRQRRP